MWENSVICYPYIKLLSDEYLQFVCLFVFYLLMQAWLSGSYAADVGLWSTAENSTFCMIFFFSGLHIELILFLF